MDAKEQIVDGEFVEEKTMEIIPHDESTLLAPAGTIEDLLGRYNLQAEFIKSVLKEGVDYGTIPGATKKTLLKPGAEKITTLFGLSISFPKELREQVEDWTGENHGNEPFFFYEDTCRLTKDGLLIAEASGSCNSWEQKYRYRQPQLKCPTCGAEAITRSKQGDKGWFCWAKKGGCGAQFPYKTDSILNQDTAPVKNPYIFDQVNTIKKMCQKRALVAATLMAGNVSDYFTQDIEDMSGGEEDAIDIHGDLPPAEYPVGLKKALDLFKGSPPTIAELYAKDQSYCEWIANNVKDSPVGDKMREFLQKLQVTERASVDKGHAGGPAEAIKNVKTILEHTEGKLTPSHYWPNVRAMGLPENTCADLASEYGEQENGWRLALEEAVKFAEGKSE